MVTYALIRSTLKQFGLFRLHRRLFHQRFRPQVVSEYHGVQRQATSELIENLTKSPEEFFKHVEQYIIPSQFFNHRN